MSLIFSHLPKNHLHYLKFSTERFRINRDTLQQCPDLIIQTQDYLLKNSSHLFLTRHCLQRLEDYLNKPSRCGTYTELYLSEYNLLKNLPDFFSRLNPSIVQLGLNSHYQVCKIGIVINLQSQPVIANKSRYLFCCIGSDLGLKTFYITPQYKYRTQYREANGIQELFYDDLKVL